ncbi:MAG: hypothetical protein AAFR87_18260 [Bacteroidota bacterium]
MQKIYSIFFLSTLFLLKGLYLSAQLPQAEYMKIHFDKSFYIAGEDVWFSLHFLSPENRKSEVVYAELFSPEGEQLIRHTLKVENEQVSGDFILPANLAEGYYTFRAYTRWNLNYDPPVMLEAQIPVYNAVRGISSLPNLEDKTFSVSNSEDLSINLEKNIYKPREDVKLNINGKHGKLIHVSVSVTDLKYEEELIREDLASNFIKGEFKTNEDKLDAEFKLKKVFRLRHPDTGEPVNSNFIMGFVKLNHQKLIRTAENGYVDFPLDNFYDSTVIQIFDASPFQDTYIPLIETVKDSFELPSPSLNTETPPLTEAVKHYILKYQHRFQVSKLFGNMDLIRARAQQVIPSQFKPTNVYRTNDFIDLENMSEFFKQAIPPVTFKAGKYKGDRYIKPRLKLYVPHKEPIYNKRIIKKPAVMLVNDYFTYDTEAILNIPLSNVEQVEIYNTVVELPTQFGPIGDFGAIAVITKDGTTPPEITETGNNIKISGFYSPRQLKTIDYGSIDHRLSKIPDFRPLIYWNPQVPISPNEKSELSFPAGDQHGSYLIRVKGITASGEFVTVESIFEISYLP